ncbi:MAG: hypothetical protein GF349_01420 [Candidatus Magasanikbacteria bacterium]|nr:hypothetical protein [Candidatus Magasanikbacteria bacterium]
MNQEQYRERKLARFELWTRRIIRGNKKVLRFQAKHGASRENVIEHEAKTIRLAMLLLAYEIKNGNPHSLNPWKILYCAATHDDGEGSTGIDHHALLKTEADQEVENHHFERLIADGIPMDVKNFFSLPIDQDDSIDDVHKIFWRCVEDIGYAYFAIGELQEEEANTLWDLQRIADFNLVIDRVKECLDQVELDFFSVQLIFKSILKERERIMDIIKATGKKLPEPNL